MKYIFLFIMSVLVFAACTKKQTGWKTITAGANHTCGIKAADNTLYCWGWNHYGQLGDGRNLPRPTPAKIGAETDSWLEVKIGFNHTCAIKASDNKLYCWGYNRFGQLGDGTLVNRSIPTKIGDDTWVGITAGYAHACGIKADKKLYCWGDNSSGQLGDGTNAKSNVPTKVGSDTDSWIKIAAGDEHTCGIKADNSLYCWGDNSFGELGDSTTANKKVPAKAGAEADRWIAVEVGGESGYSYTCGIKTDGKLYCWGSNNNGKLGDGTAGNRLVPTQIGDDKWLEITTGLVHTCGIKADKKLYCWGENSYGQLGDGTTVKKDVPAKIGNDNWLEITAGSAHTCGIKTEDNSRNCWGSNLYGKLGSGPTDTKNPSASAREP